MAFRRALVRRFLSIPKASSCPQPLTPPPRPSSSSSSPSPLFLYHRPAFRADVPPPPQRFQFPVGCQLVDRILEGISPPPPTTKELAEGFSASEVRKVLRAAQMEAVRARLRGLGRICVSYAEFTRVCGEVPGVESGVGLARALDESGRVVVFSDVVFLRPEMVAKAIQSIMPASLADRSEPARREELKEMEEKKARIDAKAVALVRREMWGGLGFLALQTAGFMRLTFWELSWDVMEPICFYVTSAYFMLGYAFFLRTSRDPSFEGFFHSRFVAKQKRLMKAHSFDMDRFNELRKRVPSSSRGPRESSPHPFVHHCDCHHQRSTLAVD